MKGILCVAALFLCTVALRSQAGPDARLSFDVASLKPSAPDDRSGRFITMQGTHQFVARNHTLKTLVMAAFNVPAGGVSGGPAWLDVDRCDIAAATPGEQRPTLDMPMAMLRTLLGERFQLTFHREQREAPVYFDLEWTPDETQFGGQLRLQPATANAKPDLFAAMQQQFGLRLQPSRGMVDVNVIDRAERP